MTPDAFKKLLLALPNVMEGQHQGHADFRLNGRIIASLGAPSAEWGMLKLPPEQQARFVALAPAVFAPSAGAWGRQGYTKVLLAEATKSLVAPAAALAFETQMAAAPAKTARSTKKAAKMQAKGTKRK